jgi:Domain of unknown function (DUF4158)
MPIPDGVTAPVRPGCQVWVSRGVRRNRQQAGARPARLARVCTGAGALRGCRPGGGFVASIGWTAYPRFNRAVPVQELLEAFTPAAGEIAWAREQTRTPEHLLALVVLVKACHRLGYFPVLAEVPPPVTEHIRGVLELKPDVRAPHDSDRTLRQRKSLVRARLGSTADPGVLALRPSPATRAWGVCSRPSPGFGASTSAPAWPWTMRLLLSEPPSASVLTPVTRAARGAARRPLQIEVHRLRLPSGRRRTIGPR